MPRRRRGRGCPHDRVSLGRRRPPAGPLRPVPRAGSPVRARPLGHVRALHLGLVASLLVAPLRPLRVRPRHRLLPLLARGVRPLAPRPCRLHHQRGARRLPQRRPRAHTPAEGERRRPPPQLARRAALRRGPARHARRAAPPRPYADGAGLRRHLRGGVVAAPAAARRGGVAADGPVPRDAPPQVQPDAHARGDEAGARRRLQEHTRQRRRRQGEREREGGRGQGLPGDAGRAARPALVRPARPRRQPLGDHHADDPSRERAVHPLQEVPGLAEAEPGLRDAGARQVRTDLGKDRAQGGHVVMARGLLGALEPHMQTYRRKKKLL
mmetsp:Transcript_41173/g.122776  ORF Transcript_41173/g.122776 Transcript_41173/m.122776 type:complete len:325 (-) Transcript_41173:9-983(-)